MKLHDYKLTYKKFYDTFDPTAYGFTWEQMEAGECDIFELWLEANYSREKAKYLRENREYLEQIY